MGTAFGVITLNRAGAFARKWHWPNVELWLSKLIFPDREAMNTFSVTLDRYFAAKEGSLSAQSLAKGASEGLI